MDAVPTLTFSNGYQIPVIGLGTYTNNVSDYEIIERAINEALLAGYRHLDCAWAYGNEKEIGRAVRTKINDGTVKREDLFIVSKLWNKFHHPNEVENACVESLQNLGIDYLDLYLMHWPTTATLNEDEKPESVDYLDTWHAMENLVDKGLVRSIGVSNFNSKQIQRILSCKISKHKPVCNQIEVTPYLSNEKLLQFCKSKDIVVTAYAPLGTPKFERKPVGAPVLLQDPLITEISKRYNKSPAQVLLRWGIQRGYVVIPKSVTPSRIRENTQIFDFSLNEVEMDSISRLNRNLRYIEACEKRSDVYYPFNEEF